MNLLDRSEFIKASPAIQIQSKITHLQRRVWNVLLANAYDELPNKDIHRVSVADLAKSLGFNSHNEGLSQGNIRGTCRLHSQVECFRQGQKGKMGRCAHFWDPQRSKTASALIVSRHTSAINCTTRVFIQSSTYVCKTGSPVDMP